MKNFNNTRNKLILILLLAFVLRLLFILTLDNTVDVWGDWWDELGWKIASGKGYWVNNPYFPDGPRFYSWRSPGFPLFLAGIYKIFGHNFLAAKIGLAFISAFTCILLYFFIKEFFNEKASLVAGFLYAIYPASVFWTGYIAPVTLEIFFLILFSLFLIKGKNENKKILFFVSGVFLGMGILTRGLFLVFVPLLLIWFLIEFGKKGIYKFLTIFAGCSIVVSPWVIRNYRIYKKFVLTSTEGGIVCYIANNENSLSQLSGYWNPPPSFFEQFRGMDEIEIDRQLYKLAFQYIISHPEEYMKLVFDRFKRFWRFAPHTFSGPGGNYRKYHVILGYITFTPLIFLSFAGFLYSLKKWRKYLWIYIGIFGWSVPIILFFKTVIRYREPIVPYLMVLIFSIFENVER